MHERFVIEVKFRWQLNQGAAAGPNLLMSSDQNNLNALMCVLRPWTCIVAAVGLILMHHERQFLTEISLA